MQFLGDILTGTSDLLSVRELVFAPDGNTQVSCDGNVVGVYSISNGRRRQAFPGAHSALAPDGISLTISQEEVADRFVVADLESGNVMRTIVLSLSAPLRPHHRIRHISYSPDGKIIAVAHTTGTYLIAFDADRLC